MVATLIELGIPALLLFILWRVWPKEGADEAAPPVPQSPQDESPQDHDHVPR